MGNSSQKYSDEMNQLPQPIRGDMGAPIMGPSNADLLMVSEDD